MRSQPLTTRAAPALLALLLLAGPVAAEVIDITNQQLKSLLDRRAVVIDVRTEGEWQQTGVIEGSHLLTFFDARGRYDARAWLDKLATIAKPDQPVVLVCRTGRRSASIAAFLARDTGYTTIYNLRDGINGWQKAGNQTTKP